MYTTFATQRLFTCVCTYAHSHILELTLRSYHLILSELITNFCKHYCTYWSKNQLKLNFNRGLMETPEDLCWLLLF